MREVLSIVIIVEAAAMMAAYKAVQPVSRPATILLASATQTDATPTPTPPAADSAFSQSVAAISSTPSPSPALSNPFSYTPLPTDRGGPGNDITESGPLTASRTAVQVDDWITFTTTIKNQAPYRKQLYDVCFESSDGNFGCKNSLSLAPGEETTITNVGSWVHPGTKNVWVTWSQDSINYYQPVHAKTVQITVLG